MSKRTDRRPRAYYTSFPDDIWEHDAFTHGVPPLDVAAPAAAAAHGDGTKNSGSEKSVNLSGQSTTASDQKDPSKNRPSSDEEQSKAKETKGRRAAGESRSEETKSSEQSKSDSDNTSKGPDDTGSRGGGTHSSDTSEKDTSEKDTDERYDSSPDSADESSENGAKARGRGTLKERASDCPPRQSPPYAGELSASSHSPVAAECSAGEGSIWESSATEGAKLGKALLIKNINRHTTVPQFCDLLEARGFEISPLSITVVHIPCNRKKLKARGFVLVHCATHERAQQLFDQFDGLKLEGHRKFRCQPADKLESSGILQSLAKYAFPEGYEPRHFWCASASEP